MALTIAVLSQKGGTGKTTAVRHLTEAFRDAGLRVLAIDPDSRVPERRAVLTPFEG